MRSFSMLKFACILALVFVPVLVTSGAVDPDTAVGIWLFDEGAGDIAIDSSGKGNDGLIELATWTDGKFGGALSFPGESGVEIPSNDGLNNGGAYTIMGYFNATELNDYHVVLAKNNQYLLRIDSPGEGGAMSSFVNLDGGWEPRASAFAPEVNTWYHYAAAYDGDAETLTVFVDGVVAGESSRAGNPTANEDAVTIGRWGGGSYFKGLIDDVAIFNVALSEADIKTIVDDGLAATLSLGGPSSVKPADKLASTWGELKK